MAGFQVSARLKNKNALTALITQVSTRQSGMVREAARVMLGAAVEYTPKYSGAATEGWRVTLDKGAANSVSAFNVTGFFMQGDIPDPIYEGGIHDPAAGALNAKVASRVVHINPAAIAKKLASGQSVSLYLYNTQPYAQMWLQGTTLTHLLRVVNRDYWTMDEITRAVRLRLGNLKRESAGGYY